MAQRTSVKVASLNMNGFGSLRPESAENKWGTMYKTMKQNAVGILLLQETHLTPERCSDVKRMFKGRLKILFSPHREAPTRKEGVAIVLNKSQVNTEGASMTEVVPGRAMQVTVITRGEEPLHTLCIYAPTSDGVDERREFFREVRRFYEARPALPCPHLMAGDFNNVEDSLDRLPVSDPDPSTEELDELKVSLGLMMSDGWRSTHPTARGYTFHRGTGEAAVCSRLDRIYCARNLFKFCREWLIVTQGVKTDHCMVSVQVSMANAPTAGKGHPVFPLHLIKDKKLTKAMKAAGLLAMQQLEEVTLPRARSDERNAQVILRDLKQTWMTLARAREKEVVPRLLAEANALEAERVNVQNDQSTPERERAAAIAKLTKEISVRKVRRIKQLQANGRAKHHLDGERPTKYWSRLHKTIAPRDLIYAFERERPPGDEGERPPVYEADSAKMAEMARAHHDSIQRDEEGVHPPCVREACIIEALDSLDARLTPQQTHGMGTEITYEECEFALRHSKSATAPGRDGLQYEVWKTMHARYVEDRRHEGRPTLDILRLVACALKDVQDYGVAPSVPFAEGWMAPIYKEKGERTKIVNYRPITLLNTDYKLLGARPC
ncbi:Endonuclease/exonuclease/phosphatase [Lenzites betulinus]|nr:Endonuclease/exonuclease/phosphatase [Lenzites betulinus]